MDEFIGKQGPLYIQRKRLRKKWEMVWAIIRQESRSSLAQMELFKCKVQSTSCLEDSRISPGKLDTVIVLRDGFHVAAVGPDVPACPPGCKPFTLEAAEGYFMFAAILPELEDWMQKLREIAFPMRYLECGMRRDSRLPELPGDSSGMMDNPIYDTYNNDGIDFMAMVKGTEAALRCGLQGTCILTIGLREIQLKSPLTQEVQFVWPYRFIRYFGNYRSIFYFEAGRRCDSGAGRFKFQAKQNRRIARAINDAIQKLIQEKSVTSGSKIQACNGPAPAFADTQQLPAVTGSSSMDRDRPCEQQAGLRAETVLTTALGGLVLDSELPLWRENTAEQLRGDPDVFFTGMPADQHSGVSLRGVASGEEQRHISQDPATATARGPHPLRPQETMGLQVTRQRPDSLYASVAKEKVWGQKKACMLTKSSPASPVGTTDFTENRMEVKGHACMDLLQEENLVEPSTSLSSHSSGRN